VCSSADTFIQKTKKLYMDTRANRNHLKMMSEDLRDIQGIMTKNIQEVLGRGEKLESNFVLSISFSLRFRHALLI
jgi:vesicle transport protein SEC22